MNGLIHFYSFDQDLNDSIGGANGSPYGSISYQDGVNHKSLYLNGNSYVSIPISLNKSGWSVSFWIKMRSYISYAGIINFRNSTYANGILLVGPSEYGNYDGYMLQYGKDNGDIWQYNKANDGSWDFSQFHHVVVSDEKSIWINGVKSRMDLEYSKGSYTNMYFQNDTRIGNDSYSLSRSIYGWIQDVAIYNRNLNQDDVDKLYNNGNGATIS